MAGRRPKPAAAKILAGNPGKRAIKAEPKFRRGITSAPDHLSAAAKRKWHEIAGRLERVGLFTEADREALSVYCEIYARWVAAKKVIAREGTTYEHNGLVKLRPEVKIAETCEKQLRQYAGEFGATPASRQRVQPSMGSQPALPGADSWPNKPDPAKPEVPNLAAFSDKDYFGHA